MYSKLLQALFVAIMLPSLVFAQSLPDEPHIYVEGAAEIDLEPDRLVVEVILSSVEPDVGVAKSDVDERSRRLIDVARGLGIEDRNVSATTLALMPFYEWNDSERHFKGTRVARNIEITLDDLSRYSELMQAIIASGVNEIQSTRLESRSADSVEDRALEAALADARGRAERLARSAGGKLGRVYSISEFQLREDRWGLRTGRMTVAGSSRERVVGFDPASLGASDSASPFTPGLLHAQAKVYVVFELER